MKLLYEQVQRPTIRNQHGTAHEHEARHPEVTSPITGKREAEGRVCRANGTESCEREQMVGHFSNAVAPMLLRAAISAATATG
jgi:hypothetical protein